MPKMNQAKSQQEVKGWEKELKKKFNHPMHRETSSFTKEAIRLFIRHLLQADRKAIREKLIEKLEEMKGPTNNINYRKAKGRIRNCVECGKSLRGRRGHPARCLSCAPKVNKRNNKERIYNQVLSQAITAIKEVN